MFKGWTIPPQVKDLPRDGYIDTSCKVCKRLWRQSVRDLVDNQHLGAQFVDLLEWQTRCIHPGCGGMVCFAIEDDELLQAA
jgi:hypothetical protein